MADQISDLSDEKQEQFHRYVQKRLRKIHRETRNQTEREQDVSTRSNRNNNAS